MIGVVDLPRKRKMMIVDVVVRMIATKMNRIVAMTVTTMMTLFIAETILLIAEVATTTMTIEMKKMMMMIAMIVAAMTRDIDAVVTTTTMMMTMTLMTTIVTILDRGHHPRKTIDHHVIDDRLRRMEATPGDRFPSEGSEGNTRRCHRWCPRLSKGILPERLGNWVG